MRTPGSSAAPASYLKRVLNALAYVGVLTIEFFVVKGRLIANEMALEVHNSGIGPSKLRDQPVRKPSAGDLRLAPRQHPALGHTAMINFLGKNAGPRAALAIEGLAFHDYGKGAAPGP